MNEKGIQTTANFFHIADEYVHENGGKSDRHIFLQ